MRWLPPLVVTFARSSPTMRGPICLSLTLVITSFQMVPAQDAASLRTAIETHYSAIHAGDSEEVWSHHLSDFSLFPGDGGLLLEPGFAEAADRMGATLEWATPNLTMSHFSAQIYDDIGIALFYLSGSYERDGETVAGAWRVSAVWKWQGGEWREAHHHESPLIGSHHR